MFGQIFKRTTVFIKIKFWKNCSIDFNRTFLVSNFFLVGSFETFSGPDSSSGRASASGSEGRRFDPRPRHTKGVKMVLVAPLLTLAIKG